MCTVAGILAAGMDCGNTRSDATSSMNLEETIQFLEPQVATKNSPARAGAMCISAQDYVNNKNSLEILCRMLGPQCTYEAIQAISEASRRIGDVSYKAMKKRKK